MHAYAITLFQRPGTGERIGNATPLLFWSAAADVALDQIRKHIDENFDLLNCADEQSLAAYMAATDFPSLEQWFNEHYCYFQIERHATNFGGKRIVLLERECDKLYRGATNHSLARESGLTPFGNNINNRWVLRGPKGEWIDCDMWRNDIAERHNLELVDLADWR